MNKPLYHALVVDDEPLVRRLTCRALGDEGFHCTEAEDGNAALKALALRPFDVVVTDLRMPNKHGHALAVELLDMEHHPQIVVLTGCIEPRLATDLLNRGVADVLFKPIDSAVLAVKVRKAVEKRGAREEPANASATWRKLPASEPTLAASATSRKLPASTVTEDGRPVVSQSEIERKLALITQILPVANVETELQRCAQSATGDVKDLVALLERDPALIVETLRLANAPHHESAVPSVGTVKDAVARIGRARIGELAVASAAIRNTWSLLIPWIDRGVTRQRSIAAGIALDFLVEQGGHRQIADGLALCARAHSLGRVVLGILFTGHYEEMLNSCAAGLDALVHEERRTFEIDHAQVMARLFVLWKLPDAIHLTFQHILEPYSSVAAHSGQLRARIELVKISALAAKLAVGRWAGWDLIEVPPAKTLSQLRIESLGRVVKETREELIRQGELPSAGHAPLRTGKQRIGYQNLSKLSCDVVGFLLASANLDAVFYDNENEEASRPVILNCLGDAGADTAERVGAVNSKRRIIVCDQKHRDAYLRFGDVVTFPTSFGRLLSAVDPQRWERGNGSRTSI
jgi:DNA-binding response OmpR family regulator